ncbi:PAS domain-containing protein [Candidatus Poribacteria bacterium]|nr:PAS domain-containing protein [Candidatus Poribacteria bacterium]
MGDPYCEFHDTFHALVDSAPVILFMTDAAGGLTYVNRGWTELTGQPVAEAVPHGWSRHVHPDDLGRILVLFAEAVESHVPVRTEYRLRRFDGEYRWVLDSSLPRFAPDGTYTGHSGVCLDITDRRETEENLRGTQDRHKHLLDTTGVIPWEWDCATRRFVFVGAQAREALGIPLEAWYEAGFWERSIHPEDREAAVAFCNAASARGEDHQVEYRLIDGAGRTRWIRDFISVQMENASPRTLRGFMVDLTELRATEEKLRQATHRNNVLLQALPDLMFLFNAEGVYLDYHAVDPSRLYVPPAEFLGRTCRQVLPGAVADRFERHLAAIRETGQIQEFDYNLTIAGKRMDFEARLIPAGRNEFMAIVRDITAAAEQQIERERLEAELRQLQKMEDMGRVAGGVAHDINNLLMPIMSFTELVAETLPRGDERLNDLEQVLAAARRAAELTKQLLAFARRQPSYPKVLPINGQIQAMERMLRRVLREDIELRLDLGQELSPVSVDPSQFDQVLLNLAVNASDAMPRGGRLTVRTREELHGDGTGHSHPARLVGKFVVLRVEDTGDGMPPEVLENIFTPFYTTKDVGKGTGLGLPIVYGIITGAGGHIRAESEPGRGTSFIIHLPAASGPCREEGLLLAAPPSGGGGETILLVEDDAAVRLATSTILARLGYKLLVAEDGVRALEVADAHGGTIDLLLTDVIMPRMDGGQLAHEIRRRRPGILILFLSGHPADVLKNFALGSSDVALVRKPCQTRELSARIRAMLDGREVGRRLQDPFA